MQAKLRQVGNSVGITIPSNELKQLSATPGDTIEVKITKVIKPSREGWSDSNFWQGASENANDFEEISNSFDEEEWQWQ